MNYFLLFLMQQILQNVESSYSYLLPTYIAVICNLQPC